MSEPSQLVVKVKISKTAFDKFCQSKPPPVAQALNWDNWLNQRPYYGEEITNENISKYCQYREKTIGEFKNNKSENQDFGLVSNR